MKPSPEKDMSMTTTNHSGGYSYRELEAAIDIAVNAGMMMARSKILIHDSRALVLFIVNAAQQFEKVLKGDDYIATVDAFAERELKAAFGCSAPAPQPDLDTEPWTLHEGEDYIVVLGGKYDTTENPIARCFDLEHAQQIVSDHRSAAAVPKLVEALKLAHACGTLRDDGTCDGCAVSEALATVQGKEQG